MPEVSLVSVFDADKEGFLRSEQSLIQTIGRAARNINGKAILYADKTTSSMQRAIDETNRRRKMQIEFNLKNGIQPKGIVKNVGDIMEGATSSSKGKHINSIKTKTLSDDILNSQPISNVALEIKKLEEQMYQHAKNLEFEQAARVRDLLTKLRERSLAS